MASRSISNNVDRPRDDAHTPGSSGSSKGVHTIPCVFPQELTRPSWISTSEADITRERQASAPPKPHKLFFSQGIGVCAQTQTQTSSRGHACHRLRAVTYRRPAAAAPSFRKSPGRWFPRSESPRWSCTCRTLEDRKTVSAHEAPSAHRGHLPSPGVALPNTKLFSFLTEPDVSEPPRALNP